MLELVGDHERHLGGGCRLEALHAGHPHNLAVRQGDQGEAVNRVDGAEVLGLAGTQVRVYPEKPPVHGLETQPSMKLHQARRIVGSDRSNLERSPISQDSLARSHWLAANRALTSLGQPIRWDDVTATG